MALYTFYLCNADGSSYSLEIFELGADADAGPHAVRILSEHPKCAYVAVWQDERPVLVRQRSGQQVGMSRDRPTPP